jgi:cell division transport system permease protein
MFEMVNDTLKQIRRTPYQAAAAIMVIFLTFLASTFFVLVSYGSVRILQYFETTPQVIAFFEKGQDLEDSQINSIKNELEQTGKLASFKYVSTKEAEAIYRERNQGNPLLLELVDYKILPPSIEITANKIEDLSSLKDMLEKQEQVTDIVFFEDIVKNLGNWIRNIKLFGGSVLVFLAVQSILIIFVIINMKIVAKKDELDILRLIGATKGFIKKPFLIEGMIYGLAGSLLAFIVGYGLVLYATPVLLDWFQDISILPLPINFLLPFAGGQVAGGLAIGFIGSYIAVSRFLKY